MIYNILKDLKSWDYIDKMNLSVRDIEEFYQSMYLDVVGKVRDSYIEDKISMPPMVPVFYYFIYLYGGIPNQDQYIRFYKYINEKWFDTYIKNKYEDALIGRLSRFYPSMLRDFHFYHVLKESKQFNKVLFVLKYDLEGKVDIFVKSHIQWYGLQLRTKTKNSDMYYQKKPNRNAIEVKAILIDLPIQLNQAKSLYTKKNDIKLYGQEHIHMVLNNIHNVEIKNHNAI